MYWRRVFLVALMLGCFSEVSFAASSGDAAKLTSYLDTLVARANALLAPGRNRDVPLAVMLLSEASGAGSTAASRKLANLLIKGDGIVADPARAATLLSTAAAAGDVRSAENLGDLYLSNTPLRDAAKAVAAYQRAAAAGNVASMRKLAVLLVKGADGVAPNPQRSEELLTRALSSGDGRLSGEALGDLYRADTSLKDISKAANAYQTAANAGSTSAMEKLAMLLLRGDGLPADPNRAEALLTQIIATDAPANAQEVAGDFYLAPSPLKNSARAAAAYQLAAQAGNASAMRKLAAMLVKGDGIAADRARALALLKQAILAGETKYAPEQLAELYLSTSDSKNISAAAGVLEQASRSGNVSATRKLAGILLKGEGINADPARAAALLEQIAPTDPAAAEALGDLYRSDGPLQDPQKALDAYQHAADAGSASSKRKFASLLVRDDSSNATDLARAEKLLKEAIAADDTKASSEVLGDLYHSNPQFINMPAAMAAYEQAVNAGSKSAVGKLALMLANGDGVPPNTARATALIDQVVLGGKAADGEEVAGDFYRALSPLRNPAKAAAAYEKAIDAGSIGATRKLAAMLALGDGVPVDQARSRQMLEAAVEAGDRRYAAEQLGKLILLAQPDEGKGEALRYLSVAADAGSPTAHVAVADILRSSISRPAARADLARHLSAAARSLSSHRVARSMMKYPEQQLVFAVQQMLIDKGYGQIANGVLGTQTQNGIKAFCSARSMPDCPVEFINIALLEALLDAELKTTASAK